MILRVPEYVIVAQLICAFGLIVGIIGATTLGLDKIRRDDKGRHGQPGCTQCVAILATVAGFLPALVGFIVVVSYFVAQASRLR